MATTQATSSGACATCGKPATTHCGGCAGTDEHGFSTSTLYCSKACQTKDWSAHKQACQSLQSRKKLSRAAQLIQDFFLAIKAEVFDLNITNVVRDEEGKLHLFEAPFGSPLQYGPAATWMDGDVDVTRAILSYCAGGDVFADPFFDVCVKAFSGKDSGTRAGAVGTCSLTYCTGYVTLVEEVDIRMLHSRVLLRRHCSYDKSVPTLQSVHHVICVTLKDGTSWAIDPAGNQHGQTKPFLPFAEYQRDYVAAILARHPYGARRPCPEKLSVERHSDKFHNHLFAYKMSENASYVIEELEEWQVKHGSIKSIIEANLSDYERLKNMLVNHLASAAREFTKLCEGDPTSTAKLINTTRDPDTLSEEDKQRLDRKKARTTAAMHPSQQKMLEDMQASGGTVHFL